MRRRDFLLTAASAVGMTCLRDGLAAESPNAELSRHRIERCELKQAQLDWPRLVGKNARLGVHGRGNRALVCRLITDRGAAGWGMVRGDEKLARAMFERIKGKPIADVFDPAVGVLGDEWLPLDFALHDLAGVILDVPVYRMLGADGPKAIDCYSGMIYFDDLEPEDRPAGVAKVLENCRQDVELGYRQLKVKIGRGNRWMAADEGLARDIEVTRQIARSFPGAKVLVDGNNGFTLERIMRFVEGIGDVPLFWIEEPFHETVKDYVELREWLKGRKAQTYLADGEASPDWKVLDELFAKRVLDVQLVDVVGYGFTPWRRLLKKLKADGHLASPHAWGSAMKTNYSAHLAAGIGGVLTIEGVTCSSKDVDLSAYVLKDGKLTVPEKAGFGMVWDA